MRELTQDEVENIEDALEGFLNQEIFSMDILEEDKQWDGEGESLEEKILKVLIESLQDRLEMYA